MARMADQPTQATGGRPAEWRIAVALLLATILFRSALFVFWERANFDSDQAVMGLMAKHLAEGRALPVFFYGQYYILGVEAWLAAPLFLAAGASVTALKLPLLAINLAIALLLFRLFTREVGLRPAHAVVAASFFALPAAGTAARLVAPDGGNVEPFLYALLIWLFRNRPVSCGLVLGIGFLHREFTLYGFAALMAVDVLRRDLFTRAVALRRVVSLATAAGVWAVIQAVKQVSSAAGPGTTVAHVRGPATNLDELIARSCVDPGTIATGLSRIVTDHWPTLFGTWFLRLTDFGIVSNGGVQGGAWAAWILAAIGLIALAGVLVGSIAARGVSRRVDSCVFLVLVGVFSIAGYAVGRCGAIDFYYTRYELLSLAGVSGLAAWFLASVRQQLVRRAWLTLLAVWLIFTAVPHVRLWNEYLRQPPEDIRRTLIAKLDERGIRYASSRYWVSYALTFLANERIIIKSDDFIRVREYQDIVNAHAAEMMRIERDPCPGGEEVMPRVYFCRPN
jgi:hypothetical protein